MMECSSCGKKFTARENYEKHMLSEEHKKKILSEENKHDDSAGIASLDFKCAEAIKCHVCNLSFTSLESFQNHSETPEHAVKIMLKHANGNQELKMTKVESVEEDSILPELNDNPLYPSYGSCKVCSKMFSGPEPYKQHIESQAHKKKIALLQNSSFGENLTLKCEPCNKSFSGQVPYAQHMSSEIHKKKMLNVQLEQIYLSKMGSSTSQEGGSTSMLGQKEDENKVWFCSICSKQCSGLIPYQQHVGGSTHFKNARRMQGQNNSVKTDMASIMEITNFIDGKLSEKYENKPQLITGNYQVNDNESKVLDESETIIGNYQRDNTSILQNDFVLQEKIEQLQIVDELGKSMKIFKPDEKIDLDQSNPKDSVNEKPGSPSK